MGGRNVRNYQCFSARYGRGSGDVWRSAGRAGAAGVRGSWRCGACRGAMCGIFPPSFFSLERSVVSVNRASQSAARAGLTERDKENTLAAGRMSEANRGAWRVFRRQ